MKLIKAVKEKLMNVLLFCEMFTKSFVSNTRAEGSGYFAPVSILIGGIIWVITIPIFAEQVQETNTTAWTFTGATGAETLYLLMPFVLIAGGVVWIIRKALD